nr:actin cytoskeleton-regulatory complex protein pan1-like [Quercus suber]
MVDLKLMMKNKGRKAEQKGPGTSHPIEVPPPVPPKAPEHSSRPTPDPQRKKPHELEEREVGMPSKITQQIYVAEEWNIKFHLEAQVAVQSQFEVERVLGQLKDDYAGLSEQLKTVTRERDNNKAGLQTAETQAEEQCKQLRASKINLATARELVEDLRAELQKAREDAQAAEQAVQLAKESVEAERKAAYQLGVDETGKELTEQFASVARDYCDLLEAPEPSPVGGASPSAPNAPGKALLPVEPAKDKGQGLDEEEIPAESQSHAPEAAAQTGQVADPVCH